MSQSPFQRFIDELRRRHVPQTAAVYLVAAWAAIQFADVVVPNLNGPAWVVTAVIVAAAVGFPVALVLAWMFDWGPSGVQKTDAPDTGTPTRPGTSAPWLATIAVLVVGIGSALAVAAFLSRDDESAAPEQEATTDAVSGDRPGPPAGARPQPGQPAMVGLDSMATEIVRGLEEGGLGSLARLREMQELGLDAMNDSARQALRQVAREAAAESESAVVMQEPSNWRLGPRVPASVAVGDTLRVAGVALDEAGVVAVSVDGTAVIEVDDPRLALPFEAKIVGRPVIGLRDVPVLVRTADGREIEVVYSLATPREGGS